MSISRFETGIGMVTEHLLSREQLYAEMKAIEDLVDVRFRLRGIPLAVLPLYIDPNDSAHNITLRYEEFPGPVRPPRRIADVYLADGVVRLESRQIMYLKGKNRTAFTPSIIYDDPFQGRYYANSQEAANAIRERLTYVFANHPHREE